MPARIYFCAEKNYYSDILLLLESFSDAIYLFMVCIIIFFLNYLSFTLQETEIRINDKSLISNKFTQFFSITCIISSLSQPNPLVNHIFKGSQYIYLQLKLGYLRYFGKKMLLEDVCLDQDQ